MDLKDKVALVTGASRGIGAATARLFIKRGASVVLADMREEDGRALADELGDRAKFIPLDVTSPEQWAAAIDETKAAFGGLDILVNNAGIFFMRPLEETTPEQFETMFRVNQLGPFLGMRTAAPALRERGGGVIVNLSSMAGLGGYPNNIAYGSTKWALRGMTRTAATELGPSGIRVVSVHPGVIDTPMNQEQLGDAGIAAAGEGNPLGRVAQAEEVAAMIAWLASDEAGFCTGSEYVLDGGASAF